MSATDTQQTLLYGAMAVAMNCIDRRTAVEALQAWAADPSRSLVDRLRERGVSDAPTLERVDQAVRAELDRHGGNVASALATLPTASDLQAELTDPSWRAGAADSDDPQATLAADAFLTIAPEAPAPERVEASGPATIDPSATQAPQGDEAGVDPHGTLADGGASVPPGRSDVNPLSSAPITPGGFSDSAAVQTPDFERPRSASALGLPEGSDRSEASSKGSEQAFAPSAASGSDRDDQDDPSATQEADEPATDFDPSATAAEPLSPEPPPTEVASEAHRRTRPDLGAPSTSNSRFRVLRPHAKGGLGSVLVAFDEELNREVALKEIREQYVNDEHSRARFLLEAEVTGGLEHPGVVPVYSLGRNLEGRPYYAMRFIRGDSLRKAIDRLHSPQTATRDLGERTLQFRNLLKRFTDVCNALEYAHSRRIIHRDIKPDNIMLGPYGETLVVDWGLAKALEEDPADSERTEEVPLRPVSGSGSTPTLDGSAIGTPAFMSPEQAEGDTSRIGTASDIYSLGATLYNLLAGVPPFTDRSVLGVLVKVRNGEFPPPHMIKPDVPKALEAICLKAMARRPEDRYPSCQALADDIEHWLADEPVSAYREPLLARLGRWAKRHRTFVTGAAILLLTALVASSAGAVLLERERARTQEQRDLARAGWALAVEESERANQNADEARRQQAIAEKEREEARRQQAIAEKEREEAERQRQVAERQREAARRQRQIAEANFQNAMDAVDALLTEVGEIDLADVPRMEETRKNLLTKALEFYQDFLKRNDTPETRLEVGRAHGRVGEILELLGGDERAERSYRRSLEILEPMLADDPAGLRLLAALAETHHGYGVLLKTINRFEDAEAMLDRARAQRERLLNAEPGDLERQANLAATVYQKGALLARLAGREAEALASYNRAIELQRAVVENREPNAEDRRQLARYLNNLALLLHRRDPEAARPVFHEAIRLQRRLMEEASNTPHLRRELARTLNNSVRIEIAEDPDVAEAPVREAVALARGLTADFPKVPDYWEELAGYLNNLGRVLIERGARTDDQARISEARQAFAEAEKALLEAEGIRQQLVIDYPSRPDYRHRLALLRNNLGVFTRGRTGAEPARAWIDSAVVILSELAGRFPDRPKYTVDLARALSEKSNNELVMAGRIDPALPIILEALAHAKSADLARPGDRLFRTTRSLLHQQAGLAFRELGRYREIAEQARAMVELAEARAQPYYDAAKLFAQAAELALADPSLHQDERERQHEAFLDEAARALQKAADAGFERIQFAQSFFGEIDHPAIEAALEQIEARSKMEQ